MTDPFELARLLLATPQRERAPIHQDLVRAIRYDGPDVPPGRACLWLLPDGTTTGTLRDAVRAWRIAAGGPTVGRPRTRPEPSSLPPGRQPSGRTRVRVQLYLDPETAAWLRAQPGGQSAAVERWAEEMRGTAARWDPHPIPPLGVVPQEPWPTCTCSPSPTGGLGPPCPGCERVIAQAATGSKGD